MSGRINESGNGMGESSRSAASYSNSPSGTKKRARYSTYKAVFEKPDREENATLSAEYKAKLLEAEQLKADLPNQSLKGYATLIKNNEAMFRGVRGTGLAALDAKLTLTLLDGAVTLAQRARTNSSTFDVDEFLARINGLLGLDRVEQQDLSEEEDELEASQSAPRRGARKGALGDWQKIGWMAAKLTRRVPGVEFMYGPLAVEHTKRVAQRRQRRASLAPEVRATEVQTQQRGQGEAPSRDEMTANVKTVYKTLRRADQEGDGVNFFQFVINPQSFGQTVENVFYVSFLIKEGLIGMQVDDDGRVLIRHEAEPDGSREIAKKQAVIELDEATYHEAIELFDIKESMIPYREYGDHSRPAAGGWYT